MFGRPNKKRLAVLTGAAGISLLVAADDPERGHPALRVLAQTATSPAAEVALPRLLATTGNLRGSVAVVLPLHFFEIVPVSLPVMPEGAVPRALPYHLAKALPRPINEYIYDWQIAQRQRDKLQLMVYLYRAAQYERMREELARKHLEIKYLEPDIFAACALLERGKGFAQESAGLIVLLWQEHISLAVYDRQQLTVVRSAAVSQPSSDPPPIGVGAVAPAPAATETPAESPAAGEAVLELEDREEDALQSETAAKAATAESQLSGWDIFNDGDQPEANPGSAEQEEAAPEKVRRDLGPWSEYRQKIVLEIMRTRDYHTSVMKGRPIQQIYVGGAEQFSTELNESGRGGLGLELQPLWQGDPGAPAYFTPLLQALALGAATR